MIEKIKSFFRPQSKSNIPRLLSEKDRELIVQIKNLRLTYLSDSKLCSLVQTIHAVEQLGIPGLIIEAGCALGGSAILLTKLKKAERLLRVYDVFGMIPAPTKEDTTDVHERYKTIVEGKSSGLGEDKYYGYEDDLYNKVLMNFCSFNLIPKEGELELIKGLVQNTLVVSEPVAMAHIDVDWYEPVMTCLEKIYPMLSMGGSIILDDYHDWGGCRKATDEFLRSIVGTFEMDDSAGSLKITRIDG
jgi:asparagine synthase (glutamine-hydrolysing)